MQQTDQRLRHALRTLRPHQVDWQVDKPIEQHCVHKTTWQISSQLTFAEYLSERLHRPNRPLRYRVACLTVTHIEHTPANQISTNMPTPMEATIIKTSHLT